MFRMIAPRLEVSEAIETAVIWCKRACSDDLGATSLERTILFATTPPAHDYEHQRL